MALPNPIMLDQLDEGLDDPKLARVQLANLATQFNALLTHLGLTAVTQSPLTIGDGLEAVANALRAKLDGGTIVRSGSGLKVNTGQGASQIPILDGSGRLQVGSVLATLDAMQQLRVSGALAPTVLAANTNNYNPTNLATATVLEVGASAAVNLTGLAGGASGRVIVLDNVGTFQITLTDEDGLSTAANRFKFAADYALQPGNQIALRYSGSKSRWVFLTRAQTPSAFQVLDEQAADGTSSLDFELTPHLAEYADFDFRVHQLMPQVDGGIRWILTSYDPAGTTYDEGAGDYAWQYLLRNASGTGGGSSSGTAARIELGLALDSGVTAGLNGTVRLLRPATPFRCAEFNWEAQAVQNAGTLHALMLGAAKRLKTDSAEGIKWVRFKFNTGLMFSGVVTMIGRRKFAG